MRKLTRAMVTGTAAMAVMGLTPLGQAVAQGSAGQAPALAQPAASAPSTTATPTVAGQTKVTQSHGLVYRGSVDLRALAAHAVAATSATAPAEVPRKVVGPANRPTRAGVPVPNPDPTATVVHSGGAQGFVALTAAQQAAVNNNGDLEPPDQGLCAHAGVIEEPVNDALAVYDENGAQLSAPVSINSFFALPPATNTTNKSFGPFISDPRCYYDAQTGRWFVTALEIDVNPYTGALGYRSSELLAVSQTSDPLGTYGLFMIDTTDDGTDGTTALANCPCFGDQPRIGADAHGFYISADIYSIQGVFNSDGGQIWALSKEALAKAASGTGPTPGLVTLYNGGTIIDGYPANAVQPAETPENGTYAPGHEYFLSTPDFNGFSNAGGAGARAVVLWTLSGTSTLNDPSPTVSLTASVIPSEPFAPPVNATQKPGPLPLGHSVGDPLPPISVNDDRMQQVVYANGLVYSSLNTGIGARGTADRSGVAWFAVSPLGGGTISHQGYLAAGGGTTLLYPAIGLSPAATGVMTFSVSGPDFYPSHAFVNFGPTGPSGLIHVDGSGTAPEDGFTCYKALGFGPACRWGDYSAASADGQGNVVMGTEIIPNTARTQQANWGTYISVRAIG